MLIGVFSVHFLILCGLNSASGIRVNAAYNKPTEQNPKQSSNPYPSFLAVDGKTDNFIQTKPDGLEPYWYVDLGRETRISWIRVYNRRQCCQLRLNGFNLTIYSDSTKVFGVRTEVKSETDLKLDFYVIPPKNGNKVELKLVGKRGTLNIAEVEVYTSCTNKSFGTDCEYQCHCYDSTEVCDDWTGMCLSGCEPGFTGVNCQTACVDGRFGFNCTNTCHCQDATEVCRKSDGHCETGCKAGFVGEFCQECEDGIFGPYCTTVCNCKDGTEVCHKSDGHCESGCKAGFTGDGCQEVCEDGRFGSDCELTCNCRDSAEVCSKSDGHCESGCPPGFTRVACDQVCPQGTYGKDCLRHCRHCNGSECDRVTGLCKGRCIPGYTGSWCDEECTDGTFGEDCMFFCKCEDTAEVCNKQNGYCQGGWNNCTGGDTTGVCPQGTYGKDCLRHCGHCNGSECDRVTGLCKGRCIPGYTGSWCDEECTDGTFGEDCMFFCKCEDTAEVCHKQNGYRQSGGKDTTEVSDMEKLPFIIIISVLAVLVVAIGMAFLVRLFKYRRIMHGKDGQDPYTSSATTPDVRFSNADTYDELGTYVPAESNGDNTRIQQTYLNEAFSTSTQ